MADEQKQNPRREFVKKAVYVVPAIVTLPVSPDIVKIGSGPRVPPRPPQNT